MQNPWPGIDFVAHWGQPEPWQSLTLPQRRRLLCLAASSHHAPSLDAALAHCRVPEPACVEVLEAAAAAGDVATCERLLPPCLGVHNYSVELAALAAAQEGQIAVLECFSAHGYAADGSGLGAPARAACYAGQAQALAWLVQRYPLGRYDDGHAWDLATAAAEGGHADLAHQLLASHAQPAAAVAASSVGIQKQRLQSLLAGLAFGCPLPAFEAFHSYSPAGWSWVLDSATAAGAVLSSIMSSATLDWDRKLAWLQERCSRGACSSASSNRGSADADAGAGVPPVALFGGPAGGISVHIGWPVAATRPDFAQRLRVLHAMGFTFSGMASQEVAEAAARQGNMEALIFALETLGGRVTTPVVSAAVSGGDLHVLQFLRQRGARLTPRDVITAAGYGRWAAAQWITDAAVEDIDYGGSDDLYEEVVWARVLSHVARSGAPLSLLQHLHTEAGAAVDCAAVAAGGSLNAERWATSVAGAGPSTKVGL